MYELTQEEFEDAVEAALDAIPDEFIDELENVVFTVADEPSPEQLDAVDDAHAEVMGSEVLGLYEGTPITQRDSFYGSGELPDVISIFKGPHERCFGHGEPDEAALSIREQVRRTVVHEIGHYFGNDDATLHALGY